MRGWFRAGHPGWGLGVLTVGLLAGLTGCGTDSFAPPPPEGLRTVTEPVRPLGATKSSATGAKPIEMILAPRDTEAAASTANFAKTQAGYDGVLVHTEAPGTNSTPAKHADLVEAAMKEKPPVLIVELPEKPDPRLGKLIQDARGQGIPVVVIGPPLPGTGDVAQAPLVRIESAPFQESARLLVKSLIRVAKNAQVDPKGGAILFFNESGDPYMNARVAAVRAALDEADIKNQITLKCPVDGNEASSELLATLEKETKVTMLIPFDFRAFAATVALTNQLTEKKPIVVAGYNSDDKSIHLFSIPNMAASADYRPAKLVRKAVQVAESIMKGEKVDPVVVIPVNFTDSAPSTGVQPAIKTPKKKVLDVGAGE